MEIPESSELQPAKREKKRPQFAGQVNLNCRFYRNELPKVDDVVVVQVQNVDNTSVTATLLEYNNIEGMMLLSEISRKRIKSVTKLTRVGKQEIVSVRAVDEDQGYIDLSKRRVAPDEIQECEKRFAKSKAVHSLLRHLAEVTNTDIEMLYERIVWPLNDIFGYYGGAYDAFVIASQDPDQAFSQIDMDGELKDQLVKIIRSRITTQPMTIRADFSMTCHTYEGIDSIKAALQQGIDLSNDECKIRIRVIASPMYILTLQTQDKNQGLQLAQEALQVMKQAITNTGGNMVVKSQPEVIGKQGDLDVDELIKQQKNLIDRQSEGEEDNEEGMDVDLDIDEQEIQRNQRNLDDEDDDEDN